jgi:hypothetical protein
VAGALPGHARGKPVEVWFQDEARVGQQGTLTRVGARRGTRPRAPRDRRYAWAYLFGAVRPERAVGAALVLPYADAAATGPHLAEIGREVAPGAHGVVVLDGAGWHAAGDLAVPENLTLLPLPRYSPELNPVENVWEYLRQNKLGHRVWPDPSLRSVGIFGRAPGSRRIESKGFFGASGPIPAENAWAHDRGQSACRGPYTRGIRGWTARSGSRPGLPPES